MNLSLRLIYRVSEFRGRQLTTDCWIQQLAPRYIIQTEGRTADDIDVTKSQSRI
jgi:hypothetical protein